MNDKGYSFYCSKCRFDHPGECSGTATVQKIVQLSSQEGWALMLDNLQPITPDYNCTEKWKVGDIVGVCQPPPSKDKMIFRVLDEHQRTPGGYIYHKIDLLAAEGNWFQTIQGGKLGVFDEMGRASGFGTYSKVLVKAP